MTPDQIIKAACELPRDQMAELVDRLTLALHPDVEEIENSWKQETRRRLAELEQDHVKPIPGEVVSERIRKIVGR